MLSPYSSGCGGCAGAGLPPKPVTSAALNANAGSDTTVAAVVVMKPPAVPTGTDDAFATDGGSGGGV